MGYTRVNFHICIGSVLTCVVLAAASYLIVKNSSSGSILGPSSDWAWLGLLFGAVGGLVIGAISGAMIVSFQLEVVNAVIFALIVHLFLGGVFLIYAIGITQDDGLSLHFFVLAIVGTINGAIVSLISGRVDTP